MIEFADLLGARPPVFAALADRWDALASTVSGQHEQWQTDIVGGLATGSWCGAASDTAGQYVSGLDGRLADHATTLRRVSATVRQSAVTFADVRSRVSGIQQQAARLGLVINPQGAVSIDPRRLATDLTDLPVSMAAAELLAREIQGAVRSANEADQRAGAAIDALLPAGATVRPLRDIADIITGNGDRVTPSQAS